MPTADWHILGPGAIGSLFAWYFAEAGLNVRLLTRNAAESARIITLETAHQQPARPTASHAFHVDHQTAAPVRRLLVTVKAHQTASALQAIRERVDAHTLILLLQNGMGTWEAVQSLFPNTRWLVGTTTEGAWRAADRHIIHTGRGATWIGSLEPAWQQDATTLAQSLAHSLFQPMADPQILQRLWRKLAINCAINPLTVLYDCRNGELLHKPAALMQMQAICREVEQVMAAVLQQPVTPLFPLVREVADSTAANHSSMLQDYRRGQPTEIEFITGYLVAQAQSTGVATPENSAVLDVIRAMSF